MGKILSDKEAKLQKKLIPLNIFVCILSLVAALSLFFMPILDIDAGKIIRNPDFMQYVEDNVNDTVGSTLEGEGQQGVDYTPAVATVVKNVLSSAQGNIKINALDAAKVAFGGEDKAAIVLDSLFFGEEALITKLIDGVAEGVAGLFTAEGEGAHPVIEDIIVATMATSRISGLNGETVTS